MTDYEKRRLALLDECKEAITRYIDGCKADGLDKTQCAVESTSVLLMLAALAPIARHQPKEVFLITAAVAYDSLLDIGNNA